MDQRKVIIGIFLMAGICLLHPEINGQRVKNVPEAFEALGSEPEIMIIENHLDVPRDAGHLQGVQVVAGNGTRKLLISGSSRTTAYLLQADLGTGKTDTLFPLMKDPYRHAGGFQVTGQYLAVGIEDNIARTTSKICLYNLFDSDLEKSRPCLTIGREGEAGRKTAGATGLLDMDHYHLLAVGNWDSRNWDFYRIDPDKKQHQVLANFDAPADWPGYQSINLIRDTDAIYAVGFYKEGRAHCADLILVSKLGAFEPEMERMKTKCFHCRSGVDFASAAGLEVDMKGRLHIWGTRRDALKQIAVNRFSTQ